jgi:hypothetical protein
MNLVHWAMPEWANLDSHDPYEHEVVPVIRQCTVKIITDIHANTSLRLAGPLRLLVRNANTWRSIRLLLHAAASEVEQEGIALDGGALLRCMYDAFLQFMFMTQQESELEFRSRLYIEFEHIERYRSIERLRDSSGVVAKKLFNSPNRPEGEARAKAAYNAVRANYPNKLNWYGKFGSLRKLAVIAGYTEEFDIIMDSLHGCAHAGPMASVFGPNLAVKHFHSFSDELLARMLWRAKEVARVDLPTELSWKLERVAQLNPLGSEQTRGKK